MKKRGFAAMEPERQRAIASTGGKRSQELGKAHRFTHDEAVAAGRISGSKYSAEYMRELGRKGGLATAAKRERQQKRKGFNEPETSP